MVSQRDSIKLMKWNYISKAIIAKGNHDNFKAELTKYSEIYWTDKCLTYIFKDQLKTDTLNKKNSTILKFLTRG